MKMCFATCHCPFPKHPKLVKDWNYIPGGCEGYDLVAIRKCSKCDLEFDDEDWEKIKYDKS
jgi:hypothetical protein